MLIYLPTLCSREADEDIDLGRSGFECQRGAAQLKLSEPELCANQSLAGSHYSKVFSFVTKLFPKLVPHLRHSPGALARALSLSCLEAQSIN